MKERRGGARGKGASSRISRAFDPHTTPQHAPLTHLERPLPHRVHHEALHSLRQRSQRLGRRLPPRHPTTTAPTTPLLLPAPQPRTRHQARPQPPGQAGLGAVGVVFRACFFLFLFLGEGVWLVGWLAVASNQSGGQQYPTTTPTPPTVPPNTPHTRHHHINIRTHSPNTPHTRARPSKHTHRGAAAGRTWRRPSWGTPPWPAPAAPPPPPAPGRAPSRRRCGPCNCFFWGGDFGGGRKGGGWYAGVYVLMRLCVCMAPSPHTGQDTIKNKTTAT